MHSNAVAEKQINSESDLLWSSTLGHPHEHPGRLGLEPVAPRLRGHPIQERWYYADR